MNKTCVSAYSFKAWGLKYHVWFDIIICESQICLCWLCHLQTTMICVEVCYMSDGLAVTVSEDN